MGSLFKFQDPEPLKWTIWHSTLAAKIRSNKTHSPTDIQGALGQRSIFIYFSCKSPNHQFCQWTNHWPRFIKRPATLFVKLSSGSQTQLHPGMKGTSNEKQTNEKQLVVFFSELMAHVQCPQKQLPIRKHTRHNMSPAHTAAEPQVRSAPAWGLQSPGFT